MVKIALRNNGFLSQRSLAEDVGFALATVNNFLTGKPVDYGTFEELCRRLSLDWREISAQDFERSIQNNAQNPDTSDENNAEQATSPVQRIEEALKLVKQILAPTALSNIQERVFWGIWEGLTYEKIAEVTNYDAEYVRHVGYQIFQKLSQALGEKVTKSNIRTVLKNVKIRLKHAYAEQEIRLHLDRAPSVPNIMTIDEAIEIVEVLLAPRGLTSLQEFVFRQAWLGLSYAEMANTTTYDYDYIKDVAAGLWKRLSIVLDKKVTKQNIRTAIEIHLKNTYAKQVISPSKSQAPNVHKFTIHHYSGKASCFKESLSDEISLTMVQIPAGAFVMGSPESEADRSDSEGPQHLVILPRFFMAKTPITQLQWRVVTTTIKPITRNLDPDPAFFKGDNHPVEQVSWDDAMEFCARLSAHTGKNYILPTEAQWEYACRAGIASPFHFGETITTDLANYRGTDRKEAEWSGSYGRGPKGEYRQTTTSVELFPSNDFGLYDMHGNVWEWCLDHWHANYQGAPEDGSAWLSSDNYTKVLRGGSFDNPPGKSRSAYRSPDGQRGRTRDIGFRVVCLPHDLR
jgi:formylglycine-generating enzyme required for sulfatase activity/transcriptional regulator with XRE-family HTH domain